MTLLNPRTAASSCRIVVVITVSVILVVALAFFICIVAAIVRGY